MISLAETGWRFDCTFRRSGTTNTSASTTHNEFEPWPWLLTVEVKANILPSKRMTNILKYQYKHRERSMLEIGISKLSTTSSWHASWKMYCCRSWSSSNAGSAAPDGATTTFDPEGLQPLWIPRLAGNRMLALTGITCLATWRLPGNFMKSRGSLWLAIDKSLSIG